MQKWFPAKNFFLIRQNALKTPNLLKLATLYTALTQLQEWFSDKIIKCT